MKTQLSNDNSFQEVETIEIDTTESNTINSVVSSITGILDNNQFDKVQERNDVARTKAEELIQSLEDAHKVHQNVSTETHDAAISVLKKFVSSDGLVNVSKYAETDSLFQKYYRDGKSANAYLIREHFQKVWLMYNYLITDNKARKKQLKSAGNTLTAYVIAFPGMMMSLMTFLVYPLMVDMMNIVNDSNNTVNPLVLTGAGLIGAVSIYFGAREAMNTIKLSDETIASMKEAAQRELGGSLEEYSVKLQRFPKLRIKMFKGVDRIECHFDADGSFSFARVQEMGKK